MPKTDPPQRVTFELSSESGFGGPPGAPGIDLANWEGRKARSGEYCSREVAARSSRKTAFSET